MTMDADIKIYLIVKTIEDINKITLKGSPILLHPRDARLKDLDTTEISQIISKLATDEKIIRIIGKPEDGCRSLRPRQDAESFKLELLPQFRKYSDELHKQFNDPISGESQSKNSAHPERHDKTFAWITYTLKRKILINDFLCIAELNFESENDRVFDYLIKHPNRNVKLSELEKEATREPIKKKLHDIVRDLGFKGELAQVFFDISSQEIIFHNPISREQAEERGFRYARIKI